MGRKESRLGCHFSSRRKVIYGFNFLAAQDRLAFFFFFSLAHWEGGGEKLERVRERERCYTRWPKYTQCWREKEKKKKKEKTKKKTEPQMCSWLAGWLAALPKTRWSIEEKNFLFSFFLCFTNSFGSLLPVTSDKGSIGWLFTFNLFLLRAMFVCACLTWFKDNSVSANTGKKLKPNAEITRHTNACLI